LSIDDRLAWQHFRRRIPWLLLHDAVLDRLCDQFSDLFPLQRDELLIGVILIKLRTIIQRMNPGVVSFQHQEVFGSQKSIVLRDDFLFQGGQRNSKLFSRWADDRSSLQLNDPVFFRDFVWMDRNVMNWHLFSKETHCPYFSRCKLQG